MRLKILTPHKDAQVGVRARAGERITSDRPLAPQPSRQADRERGHLGRVPQSTDPAERPVYGRLETYRRTEPKGGNDEHQGRNTAGA